MQFFELRDDGAEWGQYNAMIVRADSIALARVLAHNRCLEGRESRKIAQADRWLDNTVTTCDNVDVNGSAEIIMTDFWEA